MEVILDNESLKAGLSFDTGHPVVHLELPNGMTPSLFKYIKYNLLEDCMITLGTLGFEFLFSIIPDDDEKMFRFNKALGFELEREEHGLRFMVQDI